MQVEAPPIFRLNYGPKGRKICFFWRPPPLPQGLDDRVTSFSQGLDPPVNIKYCYIAGISPQLHAVSLVTSRSRDDI